MRTPLFWLVLLGAVSTVGCTQSPQPTPTAPKALEATGALAPHALTSGPTPPSTPASWLVPEWDMNPATGNDANPCTSSAKPCKTFAQIASRWGTYEPIFPQATVLNVLASQPDSTDPIPIRVHTSGTLGGFSLIGAPSTVQTGTLSGVVAKAYGTPGSPGHALEITLGAGLAVGMRVRDVTQSNSTAFIYKLVSGTTWAVYQPLSALTTPAGFGSYRSEVNSWTNGDSYVVESVPKVNLTEWNPTPYNQATITGSTFAVALFDGNTASVMHTNGIGALQDCSFLKMTYQISAQSTFQFGIFGDDIANDYNMNDVAQPAQGASASLVQGGGIRPGAQTPKAVLSGLVIGSDFVIATTGTFTTLGSVRYGFAGTSTGDGIFIDTGATWASGGYGLVANAGATPIYGPGTLNVTSASYFQYASTTAVATFLETGLQINSLTTACARSNVTASVTNCGITLSPANIDAAFGVAGFGGTVFGYFTNTIIMHAAIN